MDLESSIGLFELVVILGVMGFLLLGTGLLFGRIFRSLEKYDERGLRFYGEGPLIGGMIAFLRNPDVFAPVILVLVGGSSLLIALVLLVVAAFNWMTG